MRNSHPMLPVGTSVRFKTGSALHRVLDWLEKTRDPYVFTRELHALVGRGDKWGSRSRNVAAQLVRLGVLRRLAPGTFGVVLPGEASSGQLPLGELLSAYFGSGHALSHSTAMTIHGYGPPLAPGGTFTLVRSNDRLLVTQLAGMKPRIVSCADRPLLDVVVLQHPALGQVRVRSRVRTVLDALLRPDASGGIAQVAGFAAYVWEREGVAPFLEAVEKSASQPVVRRLGFVLQLAGASRDELEPLRRRVGTGYGNLVHSARPRGPHDSTWKLRLTVPVEQLRAAIQARPPLRPPASSRRPEWY